MKDKTNLLSFALMLSLSAGVMLGTLASSIPAVKSFLGPYAQVFTYTMVGLMSLVAITIFGNADDADIDELETELANASSTPAQKTEAKNAKKRSNRWRGAGLYFLGLVFGAALLFALIAPHICWQS